MFTQIKGYENIYQISPQGEIHSAYKKRLLKGWIEATGYRAVSLCKNGLAKRVSVHVLLAKAFIPNPNNFPEVNHKDGNKLNNTLSNLEWVTGCSNVRHAFSQGLTKHAAFLDYSKVPQLLQEVCSGTPLVDIAEREGFVETSTLRKLLKREAERTNQIDLFIEGTKNARRKILQKHSKIILQVSLANTQVLEHESINSASRSIGVNPASIFKAVKSGKPYRNFYWRAKSA